MFLLMDWLLGGCCTWWKCSRMLEPAVQEKYQTFLRENLDESVSQKNVRLTARKHPPTFQISFIRFSWRFCFPGGSNCRTRSTWSPKSQGRPKPRRTPFVPWLNREGTIRLWLFRGWLVEFVSSVYSWSWRFLLLLYYVSCLVYSILFWFPSLFFDFS